MGIAAIHFPLPGGPNGCDVSHQRSARDRLCLLRWNERFGLARDYDEECKTNF